MVIPADSPKLKEIHVDAVDEAPVPFDEVVSPGKIEANPNRVSHVTLPVTGRISTVLVKLGDAVKRGEPLLTIESPDADAAESAYLQSQAALTQAKANLNKAQADYDRSTDLFAAQRGRARRTCSPRRMRWPGQGRGRPGAGRDRAGRRASSKCSGCKPGVVRPEGHRRRADVRQGAGDVASRPASIATTPTRR